MSGFNELAEKYSKILADSEDKSKDIMEENFRQVFGSRGSNIGANWRGNDLVNTGRLRSLLTSGSAINVSSDSISVRLPTGYLFLNDRYKFLGVSRQNLLKISSLFSGGES